MMLNYFELMNLPESFTIDVAKLQQTMRALQSRFHPDNNILDNNGVSSSSRSATLAIAQQPLFNNQTVSQLNALKPDQASAVINEAYNTLKNSDTRALHLLALKGITQSINQPIRDLDFLDDAMTFRIELAEATHQTIVPLAQKLDKWLNNYESQFSDIYQKIAKLNLEANITKTAEYDDLAKQAIDIIQKLQFLVKLQADVAKTTDELAKQSFDSDDDLYV